ncbi:MAG: histidine--tRNA ligase [Clostridia bacterium]|nr:histidine--tRNA ligase [Clostridia bacterium]
MKLITNRVYGAEDILPADSYKWQFIEDIMRKQAQSYGFKEIRTPVFEHTELFDRSVGDTTDIVQKEMYTFTTKGGDNISLKPEGTAGAARAMLEHGIYNDGYPIKAYYLTACYRYEKKNYGRQREFHQFGMEVYGAASAFADAEVICAANSIFDRLGVQNIQLELNSIGCPNCRPKYTAALKEYFGRHRVELCDTCRSRLERNPMRILDCKSPICSQIAKDAPKVLDFLCEDCSTHFEEVKSCLDAAKLRYRVNPAIVRGLDYYTRTVFEFVAKDIGTICGGGRYDGLIEELGGQHTPSLGFGMGMERLLLLLREQKIEIPEPPVCDLYVLGIGEKAKLKAFNIIEGVRNASLIAEGDIVGRSVKAQMKYADKIKARFSMVIGDSELEENCAKLRNMNGGKETVVPLDEGFFNAFFAAYVEESNSSLLEQLNSMKG